MQAARQPEMRLEGARPFVETSIARLLLNRLRITHEERGISVFSGPWGIGKTTAIDAFAAEHPSHCVIVKVEPSNGKSGASQGAVMKQSIEAMLPLARCYGAPSRTAARNGRPILSSSHWSLRLNIYNRLCEWPPYEDFDRAKSYGDPGIPPLFTFIFDEAQYLSREAIEMLRFWNDHDRSTTPIPVGLVFIGNNEFSLEEDVGGQSALSGAVRSRALFIEPLDYTDITDADLVMFAQSRGVIDAGAIASLVRYYSSPRIKRDLRNVERMLATLKRRAGGDPVTEPIVQQVLQFA